MFLRQEKKFKKIAENMAYNKKSLQKMNPIKKYKLRRSKLQTETNLMQNRKIQSKRILHSITCPLYNNAKYDKTMNSITASEIQQMSYFFQVCTICK